MGPKKSVESRQSRMTAKELRKWREQKGWSQKKFAEKIGISQSTVSRWERGNRPIPLWLERFLQVLSTK